ncbi:MAG: MaoC family dehydratase N-terminal domain-containing protein [Deltaproteobacteria bacterium]|nr:MaoC family dehydratase N-terminal domain-containing protein [Deltaproteobacteria bacterium]MBW2361547.1 MaoC family dehydratase N-terminal domain-containing protein [Deltaproteobacteria bacterium]
MGQTQTPRAIGVGDALPAFERTTSFGHWNRYAAVNDEFIDVHMDSGAAQAAGQPDVFGMGNLRIAYVHNVLHDWLNGEGDLAEFSCQFRQLNFLNDRLRTQCVVTKNEERNGIRLVSLDVDVLNQKDECTMPGDATLLLFANGKASSLSEPPATELPSDRTPGVHLDAETLAWLGRPLERDVALPVGANDIRRWAMATYYPEEPPAEFLEERTAAGRPWGELVAPRDFNPFAWTNCTPPDTYPWMRGMGTEPGRRGLNGGQRNRYFAPIRVGDVITSVVTLVDAYEKEGRKGPMMFLVDEARWTNQRDELVRLGQRTTIYY